MSGHEGSVAGNLTLPRALARLAEMDKIVRRQGGEHWWTCRTDNMLPERLAPPAPPAVTRTGPQSRG